MTLFALTVYVSSLISLLLVPHMPSLQRIEYKRNQTLENKFRANFFEKNKKLRFILTFFPTLYRSQFLTIYMHAIELTIRVMFLFP